ncbi:hypothetical protein [Flavobacterium sp. UBA6031]|uniref:hypothetical protein n=1 Tax=Flavobacterium sp. UBA6031 TaxID=1946551 RepID=UPI0025BFA906|nr:hypothetical protein [Flavobacterium sp. UBA6031]
MCAKRRQFEKVIDLMISFANDIDLQHICQQFIWSDEWKFKVLDEWLDEWINEWLSG